MKLSLLLRTSLSALGRNRMRTLLSMLGIIIGVASVVAMMAIGEGSQQSIRAQISGMGTNMILVMPDHRASSGARLGAGERKALEIADVHALQAQADLLGGISPLVNTRIRAASATDNWPTSVQGVAASYTEIRGIIVSNGRMFTPEEERQGAKVCLLGKTVVTALFPDGRDPVGTWIRLDRKPVQVIGVLQPKGSNTFGQDQDDVILAPWTLVQRRMLAIDYIHSIQASALDGDQVPAAVEQIQRILMERRPDLLQEETPFVIRTQQELLEMMTSTAKVLSAVLTIIAAISLLVGGIGIMNIMLVSVTERTAEIGLRMAVGARQSDILAQFLIESVVVSLLGGVIGIAAGGGVSLLVGMIAGWPISVTPLSVALAFAVCGGTGVLFGWLPARKASRLDPILALRKE